MSIHLIMLFVAIPDRLEVGLSLGVGLLIIVILISLVRSIKERLTGIEHNVRFSMEEPLHPVLKIYSPDEIGALVASYDQITKSLESNNHQLKVAEQRLIKEKRRTEASEKAKQIFLVNISHEIRTPMNGILGFARFLEETLVSKEHQESIQMVIKSADQLMTILNDILDFSRLEAGDISFVNQPFVLKDTVSSIYKLMEPVARQKEIAFSYTIEGHVPEVISGDAVRLGQILLNLVSNALKFTEQGKVEINILAVEQTADAAIIEFIVRDTGIGIPLSKHQRIFDFFEQVTNDTSRRYAGTGLGLSIVKRLVELQSGEVFLDSKLGKGSDFYFRLPFGKVTDQVAKDVIAAESYQPEATAETGKGVRILVVEDNPINQLLVLKLLQRRGYETTVAENGKIAVEEYKNADFDVILMDLQMPEMDGYEATRLIRQMGANKKDVPIVAMTAHTIKGELEKCAAIGMNDYISKPFNSGELYQKIELLVESNVDSKR